MVPKGKETKIKFTKGHCGKARKHPREEENGDKELVKNI